MPSFLAQFEIWEASNNTGQKGVGVKAPFVAATALALVSLSLFLWGIRTPSRPFYDEIQYISSAQALLVDGPNPNPEAPPLGKLLVAIGMALFGNNPLGWRIMSALFGASTLVGIFLWVRLMLRDHALALLAAVLTALNNFLFVMSRVAMMDIFLVTFIVWGLVGFTAVLEIGELSVSKRRLLLISSGAMFGAACACKWNGVDTLGIVILVGTVLWMSNRSTNDRIKAYGKCLQDAGLTWVLFSLLVVPIVTYGLTFWPLLHSLHHPFKISTLIEMNVFIWRFHRTGQFNRGIAVPWYMWPVQASPQRALSYLVGNWFIMWGGLLAVGYCTRRLLVSLPETFVVLLFAGNLLQWAVTPQRCLYYYYYFPAAIFLGVAIAVALRHLPTRVCGVRLALLCVVAASVVFVYCYPRMAHLESPFDCALGCWN
jgi:dolichyl-phosphate-mannose-protein mannosyltransferase